MNTKQNKTLGFLCMLVFSFSIIVIAIIDYQQLSYKIECEEAKISKKLYDIRNPYIEISSQLDALNQKIPTDITYSSFDFTQIYRWLLDFQKPQIGFQKISFNDFGIEMNGTVASESIFKAKLYIQNYVEQLLQNSSFKCKISYNVTNHPSSQKPFKITILFVK